MITTWKQYGPARLGHARAGRKIRKSRSLSPWHPWGKGWGWVDDGTPSAYLGGFDDGQAILQGPKATKERVHEWLGELAADGEGVEGADSHLAHDARWTQALEMDIAPAPSSALTSTVFGVPLLRDERVIFYQRINPLPERVFMFVVGIPLILMLGLGIYVIYSAIKHRKGSTYAQVITTDRVICIDGEGNANFAVAWDDVAALYEKRKGGGLHAFGVEDRAGTRHVFLKDLGPLRDALHRAKDPAARRAMATVAYDAAVL